MKKYHFLIPEYVPLSNKGEEAIVRGIADSLFPEGNCEIHLFDMNTNIYRFYDGIHIYPGSWFFPTWVTREFGLGASWEKIRDSFCSLIRHALNKIYPNWVKITPSTLCKTTAALIKLSEGNLPGNEKEKQLMQLLKCDFIIAGHDGGFDEWVCHVIRIMRESFKKEFGIYGVQLRDRFKNNAIKDLHSAQLEHSKFFYCRDAATANIVKMNFKNILPEIAPDPAFAMKPASEADVDNLIIKEGLVDFFKKPVVMCTCCEPAPIARYCFDRIRNPEEKLNAHRALFAQLIQYINDKYQVNILFLPHALGPGRALDDRRIAKDILVRANLPQNNARLLNVDISARLLKGLIGKAEFLVAERIHSVIGASGMTTPFLCLGSKTDYRITGIISEMLNLTESVYYLHMPIKEELFVKFDMLWEKRGDIKNHLDLKRTAFLARLTSAAETIRGKLMTDVA